MKSTIFRASIFLVTICGAGFSQTTISGTVVDSKSNPVSGSIVFATLQSSSANYSPFQTSTLTGSDGSFTFSNLSAGTFQFCVQSPGTTLLDPCQWGTARPTVTVTAAQNSAGNSITLANGYLLPVKVLDPLGILSSLSAAGTPADLLANIGIPGSMYVPLVPQATNATEVDFSVAIPYDTAVNLEISSSKLQFSGTSGNLAPNAAAPIGGAPPSINNSFTIIAPSAGPPVSFSVSITGQLAVKTAQ